MKQKRSLLALLLALMLVLSACATVAPGKEGQVPEGSDGQTVAGNNEADDPAQNEDNAPGEHINQTPEPGKSYEEYLSALCLFALSMEYPDFQFQGVYTSSAVTIMNKASSQGIYVFFDSMGESYCVCAYPLEAERTESGSLDVFANELGYAAFDILTEQPDTNDLSPLDSQIFGQLLSELNGVSLYNH